MNDVLVYGTLASSVVGGRGSSWRGYYCQLLLGRSDLRSVDNLHVAVLVLTVELLWRWVDSWLVITELEESLYSTRRVLRSLTIVTVGQTHDQTSSLKPFTFTGSKELINDTLSVVAIRQQSFLGNNV